MSLVTQMVRDLESESPAPEMIRKGELPLFAAANLLYGKHHQPTAKRARLILLIALLLALILILVDRVLLPSQYKLNFNETIDDSSLFEDEDIAIDKSNLYDELLIVKKTDNEYQSNNDNSYYNEPAQESDEKSGKEPSKETKESSQKRNKESNKESKEILFRDNSKAKEKNKETNIERRLIYNEDETTQLYDIKNKKPLSDKAIDLGHYEKAMTFLAENGAIDAIAYLSQYQAKSINDIKQEKFFKSAILHASLLIGVQRFLQAEGFIDEYQQSHPSNSDFSKLRIRLALAQKNYSQSLTLLDALAIPINVDADFEELRAVTQQAVGQYIGAQNTYKELLEFDNRISRWWMGLAIAFDSSADFKNAEQAYQQVLLSTDLTPEHSAYALRRITVISR